MPAARAEGPPPPPAPPVERPGPGPVAGVGGVPHLVLYDGLCGLCDRTVRFLLRHDPRGTLHFAPLQGATAARLTARLDLPRDTRTVLLVVGLDAPPGAERVLERSDAVLTALGLVGGAVSTLRFLRVVPRFVRDAVYDLIARHRHRWFGRFDTCPLPAPEHRSRFLD